MFLLLSKAKTKLLLFAKAKLLLFAYVQFDQNLNINISYTKKDKQLRFSLVSLVSSVVSNRAELEAAQFFFQYDFCYSSLLFK